MKMTKNWKRFWTLDRHHAEGFTLVELIVVIAILAILAGVAVPAYSGYINEANKTADRTLIRDIEQALMMGYYQGLIEDNKSGKIVLSQSAPVFDENAITMADGANLKGVELAMQASFGAGYAEKLVLKHDKWDFNETNVGLLQAKAVYDSSYYKSADKLMGQVEEITKAAWSIVNDQTNGEMSAAQMKAMLSDGDMDLDGLAQSYGYDQWDSIPEDALPNMMVLAVASDVTTSTNMENAGEEYTSSKATNLIKDFALWNGFASTNSEFASAYETFVNEINKPGSDVSSVAQAYNTLKAQATGDAWEHYKATQSETDLAAFNAMMGGMAGAAMHYGPDMKNSLSQQDFFTSGLGNELFTDYIDTVGAMAGMSPDQAQAILEASQAGNVVVFYTVTQGKIYVGNTLPSA